MKRMYLLLTVLGFVAPNILVFIESIETGNVLLYTNPVATFEGMFANRISTIFGIDLLFAVLVFFTWSYQQARSIGLKGVWLIWLFTMFFGLASGFPLFLFLRERMREVAEGQWD